MNKLLITAVMIGKLQQSVTYEGIHKLCFECGRTGHRRESYPYVVRPVPLRKRSWEVWAIEEQAHMVCVLLPKLR